MYHSALLPVHLNNKVLNKINSNADATVLGDLQIVTIDVSIHHLMKSKVLQGT